MLGKSLVPSPVEADVWAGTDEKPRAVAAGMAAPEPSPSGISLSLAGPWAFYRAFYRTHGLQMLQELVAPETALGWDRKLWVPLLLRNGSNAPAEITLHADLPAGWRGDTADRVYRLEGGAAYPIQLFLTAPVGTGQDSPQTLAWTARAHGAIIGRTTMAVYPEYNGVPQ